MPHMEILFRQVEGYTKCGVNGKQMEAASGGNLGVQASNPTEEGCSGALGARRKTDGLAHCLGVFVFLHASAGCFPKLLSQTQKFMVKM